MELRPLEHVLDEQRLVRVAHVGADHGELAEVDEHVFEQHRVLAARAHLRAGDADVDRHGQAELLRDRVHRVVEAVVELVLLDERRHPHHAERGVLRELAHAGAVHAGTAGLVDGGRHEEAAGVLVGDGEEVLRRVAAHAMGPLRVAQAAGEHADVDAGVVHGLDEALDRRALGEVVAEEGAHPLVLLLRHPLGGEGFREQVHPCVDDHGAAGPAGSAT